MPNATVDARAGLAAAARDQQRSFGRTRQHDPKGGLVVAAGFDVNRAAMSLDDLKHDVQPEAEALASARGSLTAPEGIEQVVLEFVGNDSGIHDGQAD